MNRRLPPNPELVAAYWADRVAELGLGHLERPAAWSFGGTGEQADELLRLVVSGVKTATSSALWTYEVDSEPLPVVAELAIVCDGRGRPGALTRITHVSVIPLDGVSPEHARAEGEGDRTLAHWRRTHEEFFRTQLPPGRALEPTMPLVLERFECLAPRVRSHLVGRPASD